MVAGAAAKTLGMGLSEEQEVLMNIADMAIDTYMAESLVLRTQKLGNMKSADEIKEQTAIAQVYVRDMADRIHKSAKDAINAFATGDEQRGMLMGAKRFTKTSSFNTKDARRMIAAKMIEANEYPY